MREIIWNTNQGKKNMAKSRLLLLAQFISYLAFTLMGWVSWPLYIFMFLGSFSALWWPNIWLKMGFPELFEKLLAQLIPYLAFTLMGWVSWPLYIFVFLSSFLALRWPNIWPKMGFPELLEKTIGSIQCFPEEFPPVYHTTANRNLYWIFLDEVGSDQSGGILSPFMGTACSHWSRESRPSYV